MSATVVMKTRDGVGEFILNSPLPNGKAFVLSFTKAKDFTAEVPTLVTYQDPLDKSKFVTAYENFAQHVLDHYSDILEIVQVKKSAPVEVPVVTETKRKFKKEKTNEEVS